MRILATGILLFASVEAAAAPCSGPSISGDFGSATIASAGSWANLRGSAGSLKAETKRLLTQALAALRSRERATVQCTPGCSAEPVIVFKSTPNAFLPAEDYTDAKRCQELATAPPREFPELSFETLDELQGWFGDFSQGKGRDGAELYRWCEGSCSPTFTILIRDRDGKLAAKPIAGCGEARDKGENNYRLTAATRTGCF